MSLELWPVRRATASLFVLVLALVSRSACPTATAPPPSSAGVRVAWLLHAFTCSCLHGAAASRRWSGSRHALAPLSRRWALCVGVRLLSRVAHPRGRTTAPNRVSKSVGTEPGVGGSPLARPQDVCEPRHPHCSEARGDRRAARPRARGGWRVGSAGQSSERFYTEKRKFRATKRRGGERKATPPDPEATRPRQQP